MSDIVILTAKSCHSEMIWEWRNDPITIYMSRNAQPISLDQHSKWFQNIITDKFSHIYVLIKNTVPVGMARFDLLKDKKNLMNNLIFMNKIN